MSYKNRYVGHGKTITCLDVDRRRTGKTKRNVCYETNCPCKEFTEKLKRGNIK